MIFIYFRPLFLSKVLLEALMTSFGLGFSESLDMNELSMVCLLHLLRSVLTKFSAPLFTYAYTEELCVTQFHPSRLHELCEMLLQGLPEANYFSSRRALHTLRLCSFGDDYLFSAYASFFLSCFFRLEDELEENWKNNAKCLLLHLLKNYDKFPPRIDAHTAPPQTAEIKETRRFEFRPKAKEKAKSKQHSSFPPNTSPLASSSPSLNASTLVKTTPPPSPRNQNARALLALQVNFFIMFSNSMKMIVFFFSTQKR